MTLKDLAVKHPYYCHTNNYYSNDALGEHSTWKDFYDEFKDADIDMNLVFRWDIEEVPIEDRRELDNTTGYRMKVFIMGQRKGLFIPQVISNVSEEDVEEIMSFLTPHMERLKEIWSPFFK
jgi:hypothetical protein